MNQQPLEVVELVKEFHTFFKHPVLPQVQIPSLKRAALRINLIEEETKEFEDAIEAKDIVEVADALADILYVTAGAVLEFGLQDKMGEIFRAVHESNMSKASNTIEQAIQTVDKYTKMDQPCHYVKEGDYYFVYRDADKKLLKSVGYTPVDIKAILEK